jgi:hypothetical protein
VSYIGGASSYTQLPWNMLHDAIPLLGCRLWLPRGCLGFDGLCRTARAAVLGAPAHDCREHAKAARRNRRSFGCRRSGAIAQLYMEVGDEVGAAGQCCELADASYSSQ